MSKKEKELDFAIYQEAFGKMYHLIRYTKTSPDNVRFVHYSENPKYTAINGRPIFFSDTKELCIATEYTIIYPKVYVRRYVPMGAIDIEELQNAYIH